jgi:hypothetical protein
MLSNTSDLDRLLGQVLRTIVAYLGEHGGSVWLYDEERDKLGLRLTLADGQFAAAPSANHPDAVLGEEPAFSALQGYDRRFFDLFPGNTPVWLGPDEIASLPNRDYVTVAR